MYFVFLFIYVYVFYIKLFSIGQSMLNNNKTMFFTNHTPRGKLDSGTIIQYDTLKGKSCNNQIVRLTRKSINCESLCGSSYTKKTLDADNLYSGIGAGVYCIPRELDSCHPYTGIIVKDSHGWSCVSKYPLAFAGPDADDIVTCNGDLMDRMLPHHPVVYKNKIPRNLQILDNPDRVKTATGEWRFACPPNRTDNMNNHYVSTDVSRLHTVHNACAQMLVNDKGQSMPDFNTGKCVCPDNYSEYYDARTGPYCAPDLENNVTGARYFYEPCLKPNQMVNDMLKPCPLDVYNDAGATSLYKYEIGISDGLSVTTYNDLTVPL